MQAEDEIIDTIMASTKYKFVSRSTVTRIVKCSLDRYGLKRAEGESRRLLHQIWGMYYEKFNNKIYKIRDTNQLLELHTSVRERLPYLREFYGAIFRKTGYPQSIVDYGSGLNPLAFAMLGLPFPEHYSAFDIDSLTVNLLNKEFAKLDLGDRFAATVEDLLDNHTIPVPADVSLLLKVLPPLELQSKGSSRQVLMELQTGHIIVSYPTKSISGRQKGMADFYRNQFYNEVYDRMWRVQELTVGNELIFIIQK